MFVGTYECMCVLWFGMGMEWNGGLRERERESERREREREREGERERVNERMEGQERIKNVLLRAKYGRQLECTYLYIQHTIYSTYYSTYIHRYILLLRRVRLSCSLPFVKPSTRPVRPET